MTRNHDWFFFRGLTCCRSCGVVMNSRNTALACRGPVRDARSPRPRERRAR